MIHSRCFLVHGPIEGSPQKVQFIESRIAADVCVKRLRLFGESCSSRSFLGTTGGQTVAQFLNPDAFEID